MHFFNFLKIFQRFSPNNSSHKKEDLDYDDPNGRLYGCFQHLYFDRFSTNEYEALQEIELARNHIIHISFYLTNESFFLKMLKKCSVVVKNKINLTIFGIPITDNGLNVVPGYLSKLKLSSLRLKYCSLESGLESVLFKRLNECKYLRKLSLLQTEINYEVSKIISDLLLNENVPLRTLSINNHHMSNRMLDVLLTSAEKSKSLQKLVILVDQILPELNHKIINLLNNVNIISVEIFYYDDSKKCKRRKIGYDIEKTFNGFRLIIHYYNLYLEVYILILKHILQNPNLRIVEIVISSKNDIRKEVKLNELATFSELFEIICEKNIIIPKIWLNKEQIKRMKVIKNLNKAAVLEHKIKNKNKRVRFDSNIKIKRYKRPISH